MNPFNPLPIFLTLLLALASTHLLLRRFAVTLPMGRVSTIDGLRGNLAVGVFLYHSCIWFCYLRTGIRGAPPSRLYTHLGQGAVIVFFMITGFLFFSKLLDQSRPLDWTRLYISRLFRLAPLYLVAIAAMLLIVGILSAWKLQPPLPLLASGVAHWLALTWADHPELNGVALTSAP